LILGYAGKFLEIDLSDGTFKDVRFDEALLKDYVGAGGLQQKSFVTD